MANLSAFRKNKVSVEELQKKLSPKKGYEKKEDERMWFPERDEAGNAATVIRFLPSSDGETLFQTYYDHYFETKNGWYIDKCRTTLDDGKCPVCEANKPYWRDANHNRDAVPKEVRARTRRTYHVANILVIKDPANPENEGKVFLFRFGNYIKNKIVDAAAPVYEDDVAIQPFDFWDGANFNFRIHKKGNGRDAQTSYENSNFAAPSSLFDGDEDKLSELIEKLYDVTEFSFADTMTSYEDQLARFNRLTGEAVVNEAAPQPAAQQEAVNESAASEAVQAVEEPTPAAASAVESIKEAAVEEDVDVDQYAKYFPN